MTTPGVLMALLRDNLRIGPIVNARMTAAAVMGLPYGVAFAGAQSTIQAVDSGEAVARQALPLAASSFALRMRSATSSALHAADSAEGAALLTAHLVDLGYERLVVSVVLNLVDRDRADIVVKVRCRFCLHHSHYAQHTDTGKIVHYR